MPFKPFMILVVDDSQTTRALIKRVIAMTGLPVGEIHEAASGRDALAIMASHRIGLVLTDLNMPVMDGVEMIRQMRQNESFKLIPVAVISAQPDVRLIERLKRDGVDGYLPKPFTPEGVRDLIGPLFDAGSPRAPAPRPHADLPKALNAALAESLGQAMETMAFVCSELSAERRPDCALADLRIVRVAFHGKDVAGSLLLAAPFQFGALIAANCNGPEDASLADKEADDALMELTNVACGVLFRKRICGSAGFEMKPPVLVPVEGSQKFFVGDDVVALNADGFVVLAHVTCDASIFEAEGAVHGH